MVITVRFIRLGSLVLAAILVLLLVSFVWLRGTVRASLPRLDGEFSLAGLQAPASIERDHQGVVTIRGENRADVARALGFAHAQDRFFQMDTLRRFAAGELSELLGDAAINRDRLARLHGFRRLTADVMARLTQGERDLIEAYAEGVNAGLASLDHKPFEYVLLRAEPVPWRAEDCLLVLYAKALDLQDETGHYEQTLAALRDSLGEAALDFFAPLETPEDAALDDSSQPLPAPPGLRLAPAQGATAFLITPDADPEFRPGSNAFGLAGGRTASGSALLANDMHLGHSIPNIWYRARLTWADHDVTGVTLPGAPVVIAGSNGHIAWGFTNSYTDTGDLVPIDTNELEPSMFYNRGTEILEFETRRETIPVRGGDPVDMESRWTVWGPLVGTNARGRPLALKWIMHDPAAVNFRLLDMETARTTDEAVTIAHVSGIPTLNILIADRAGNLTWTIAGRLPNRFGLTGRLPVSWSFGDRGWDGLVPPAEIPVVRAKADGHLWSANQRMLGGPELARLGDGGYEYGARARQIRDALVPLGTTPDNRATPRDLLAIQLDDRALWLESWQQLLLTVLDDEAVADHAPRRELRDLVTHWEGRAAVDSISYRLVRGWREIVADLALAPYFTAAVQVYPGFNYRSLPYEHALWALVTERPVRLPPPGHHGWEDLLLAAADRLMAELDRQGVRPDLATWGARNTVRIRHPLSPGLPGFAARWLDLPAEPLPGDNHMPRVQSPRAGASQRFVVAPGSEDEGIFHMPGGQSGHPLSPFYRAGHEAWSRGEASPFLPGETLHTLTLKPAKSGL